MKGFWILVLVFVMGAGLSLPAAMAAPCGGVSACECLQQLRECRQEKRQQRRECRQERRQQRRECLGICQPEDAPTG